MRLTVKDLIELLKRAPQDLVVEDPEYNLPVVAVAVEPDSRVVLVTQDDIDDGLVEGQGLIR